MQKGGEGVWQKSEGVSKKSHATHPKKFHMQFSIFSILENYSSQIYVLLQFLFYYTGFLWK